MTKVLMPLTAVLALVALSPTFAETAASTDARTRDVSVDTRRWLDKEAPATACTPTAHISVDRFFASPSIQSGTFDVRVLVDGKIFGTERLTILQPTEAKAERVELLRFYPRERLRLLDLVAEGAMVEIRSEGLGDGALPLNMMIEWRDDSSDATRADSLSELTITRSTWKRGSSDHSDQSGLRTIFAAETFAECMDNCQWVEEDCISFWNCDWADQQCLGHCEQEEDQCEDDCPCTGFDPILVRQYATQERIIVSGPHGSVCLKDAFSTGNVFYDVYTVFTRTRTYRVWEDCHGNQTTELVSTQNSGNHTCYLISDQFCSPALGPPPACRMP